MTLEFSLEILNGKDALVQALAGLPGVLCPGDGHPGRLGHHGRRHHLHLSGGRVVGLLVTQARPLVVLGPILVVAGIALLGCTGEICSRCHYYDHYCHFLEQFWVCIVMVRVSVH